MRRLLAVMDGACYAGAIVAGLGCLALAVMLIAEVLLTSFFGWSQPWSVEYSGYLLAATLFAGAGWALRQGSHIRVGAVIHILPKSIQRWLDVGATVFAIGVCLYMAVAVTENAWRSFELGSTSYFPSRTPLVYPQAVLAIGVWLLVLAFVGRLIRLLIGDAPEVLLHRSESEGRPE